MATPLSPTVTRPAEARPAEAKQPRVVLPMELLDYSADAEDCPACMVADALWPTWQHGDCPYHLGVRAGIAHARAQVAQALDDLEE